MAYIGKKPANVPLTASDITDGIITSAKIADGAVSTVDIADANVTAAKLASGTVQNQSAFKNIIINGDMRLAQRATSTSSITSDNTYPSCDRWKLRLTTLGTWTQSQSTDVPTGQGFSTSLKMDCTTADASPAASDRVFVKQAIEGQNLQYLKKGTSSAESTTVSFWVRSNKTGTYICELYDEDNSRSISKSYTISSADTWEKKELTFAGDTSGAFGNDNGDSLGLHFWLGTGTTYSSGTLNTSWGTATNANRAVGQVNLADSTSNEWYITGVQFETGTSASDFEFLPAEINGFRCCRYYQLVGISMYQYRYMPSVSQNWSGSAQLGTVALNFPMRANPTTITSGSFFGSGSTANDNNCIPGSATSIAGGFSTMHRFSWNANQNSQSLGKGAQYYTNGDSPTLAFDAEL